MSGLDEFDDAEWQKRCISASREYRYEQMRKLHTVWYLNYAPASDPCRDESIELSGPQIQLAFDMGYRLALKQITQYLDKSWYSHPGDSKDGALKRIASFAEGRIEDSFCLNHFNHLSHKNLHEQLFKSKEEFEENVAIRDWIGCPEYEE